MPTDVLTRIRMSRAATLRERTARIRMATFAPGAGIDSVPTVEAIGLADLASRRVILETRPAEQQLQMLRDLAVKWKREQELEQTELGSIDLFIGDDHYERAKAMEHWVRTESDWYWRPLWALDVLDAAAGDWVECEPEEVHGHAAATYSGSIDGTLLRRIDPHWKDVLGRGGKHDLQVRVWLDPADRVLRVAWQLPASQPKLSVGPPSWYATEYWEFGTSVNIDPPRSHLVRAPGTLRLTIREMIREGRAARKGPGI